MDYRQYYNSNCSKRAAEFSPAFPRQMQFLLRWMGFPDGRRRALDLGGRPNHWAFTPRTRLRRTIKCLLLGQVSDPTPFAEADRLRAH